VHLIDSSRALVNLKVKKVQNKLFKANNPLFLVVFYCFILFGNRSQSKIGGFSLFLIAKARNILLPYIFDHRNSSLKNTINQSTLQS
jgi:hypothetical protein